MVEVIYQAQEQSLFHTDPEESQWNLAHETPNRLRFTCVLIRRKDYDSEYLIPYFEKQQGVKKVRVNKLAGSLLIRYNGDATVRETIFDELAALALRPNLCRVVAPRNAIPAGAYTRLVLYTASLIATPLMPMRWRAGVTFAAILPSIAKAAKTLVEGGLKPEVLDATALIMSALSGYYTTAQLTQFLREFSGYLEQVSITHTEDQLRHFTLVDENKASVATGQGIQQVPAEQLKQGSVVVAREGEYIPVDGTVIQGEALVSIANLGFYNGREKRLTRGSSIYAGSLVLEGSVFIWAERVLDDTELSRLRRFIDNAIRYKDSAKQVSDQLTDRLVPYSFALSGVVYGLTRDLSRSAAMLTVDYATPIELAMPVALESSIYASARNGILFRQMKAFDKLARAQTFVFDKTGTLTQDYWVITQVNVLDDQYSSADLLSLFNTVLAMKSKQMPEEMATELYATAIPEEQPENRRSATTLTTEESIVEEINKWSELSHSNSHRIEQSELQLIEEYGISQITAGKNVIVGTADFLHSAYHLELLPNEENQAAEQVLYLLVDQQLVASMYLHNPLRPEALESLNVLKSIDDTSLILMTSDKEESVSAAIKKLPFDQKIFAADTATKSRLLQQISTEPAAVVFVSDGYPSVAAPDTIKINMPKGADNSKERADIYLLIDDLRLIPAARSLAKTTAQSTQLNQTLALFTNSLVLLATSLRFISPTTTSLLHNGINIVMLALSSNLRNNQVELEKLNVEEK